MAIVNKGQLAEILGKSERTLTTWQKNGMPIALDGGRGANNQYKTEEVIAWIIEQEINRRIVDRGGVDGGVYDYDAERSRLTHHQANKADLEEQVLRGHLIPYQTVERVWCDMVSAFRARILSIPTKAAHQMLHATDLNEAQALLKTHVHEALQELADYEPSQYDLDPGEIDSENDSPAARLHS